MADRFLSSLLPRLRFALGYLPVLQLVALLLVAAAALVQLLVLPGRETAIEESERSLARLERSARRATLQQQVALVSPENTRQRLLERFPGESQLNAELGRLIALASEQGLQVPSGDYRLQSDKGGLFERYVLNLPAKGSYQAIRSYVAAVRREHPDVAVEDITLHRDSIGSAAVEAQLRFVLFGRRAAA